jgi:hypothetical protein
LDSSRQTVLSAIWGTFSRNRGPPAFNSLLEWVTDKKCAPCVTKVLCVCSPMVRIDAFQASDPGSIPGDRMSSIFASDSIFIGDMVFTLRYLFWVNCCTYVWYTPYNSGNIQYAYTVFMASALWTIYIHIRTFILPTANFRGHHFEFRILFSWISRLDPILIV